ncbi:hypothetical protein TNCV_3839341 [Trichonephila clavipes]|nr:hypothetical protein TNCV_3839341 [Trichonephila clavipes]
MSATELGLASSDNLKIIELKDLITNSDRYDEEFVKDVICASLWKNVQQQKNKRLQNWRRNRKLCLWLSNEKENSNLKK